jgi:hypothetical protein
MITTEKIPSVMFAVHTPRGNEFYEHADDAKSVKSLLDASYIARGLSKRTPMYRVKLDYEIYDGS